MLGFALLSSACARVGAVALQPVTQAESEKAEFVTWFFSTDPRYVKVPPGIAFINSFKSMGLATPRFQPKPALGVWRSYLALPLVPAGS